MDQKKPHNKQFTTALPRDTVLELELISAERTVATGIKTTRTDLIKLAVYEWLQRNRPQ